ncbi:unnamed protein product, partial [Rotaria sp. Silwood2]
MPHSEILQSLHGVTRITELMIVEKPVENQELIDIS